MDHLVYTLSLLLNCVLRPRAGWSPHRAPQEYQDGCQNGAVPLVGLQWEREDPILTKQGPLTRS